MLSRLLVRSADIIWRAGMLLLLAVSLLGGTIDHRAAAQTATGTAASTAYEKLPLSFELNQGQADPAVDFVAHGPGFSLALSAGDALLSLGQAEPSPSVLRVQLQGAEPHPQAVGQERLGGTANYFLGTDPGQWHTGIPTYARVQYQDVYPGIDLVYDGQHGQLEDDFAVAPHVDPGSIRLRFEGSHQVSIDPTGDLVVDVPGGQLRQSAPVMYQDLPTGRQTVAGRYVSNQPGEISFGVDAYDADLPLIIDPVLRYSTFLGGGGRLQAGESGNAIAADASGNAYVTGITSSAAFPTTPGALQGAFGGVEDAFVSKLNPTGTALVYSTFLGGSSFDDGLGIAVDAAGNAYVMGDTFSADFPTTSGAFQRTLGDNLEDNFVSKLDPTGTALVYSTFLGGGSGIGGGIAVDADGNAYVTAGTLSADFPTTAGAFQRTYGGGLVDAFVSKLNPTGSGLVYSTFLGGNAGDSGSGIAVDAAGNAYVAGTTASTNFPTTPITPTTPTTPTAAFQATLSGSTDAFVTKLNPSGSALVYSTFLGGSSSELGKGIAVDAGGNAYVTGQTFSADFPTTPGAMQRTPGGAFVSKLDPTGGALVYSSFLPVDTANAIAVDTHGDASVTGQTSSGLPTTPGAFQRTLRGAPDAFVIELNPTGSAPIYATFVGGTSSDTGTGIAVDPAGDVYVTGLTFSTDFPTTAGAMQRTLPGLNSGFVARIAPGPPACDVQALLAGPPTRLQVLVHADRGLDGLVVSQATNTSVSLPTFTPGSTGTFLVTATKLDQSAKATFTLHLTDQTGSSVDCDPALVSVGRAPGDSPVQVIHHVAQAESHVTITNGTPDVSSLRLLVNGHSFEATDLHDGESRTLDVSSALRHGSDNTILVIAHGPRNSSAVVLVSDS